MSVGIEVISRPLCKWNIYDVADFLYENGKNMNSDNWQRIADDMAMVAGDVRKLFGEALQAKQDEIDNLRRLKPSTLKAEVSGYRSQLRDSEKRVKELEKKLIKIDEIINGTE